MRNITSINVYDFDSTLCASPENTQENRTIWESKTGKIWAYKGNGWWSKEESLDCDIFDIELHPPVSEDCIKSIDDVSVYTVLLTGRMPKFETHIKEICRRGGLGELDAYYFNDSHDTLKFKLSVLNRLKNEFPCVKEFVMWEDREEHITHFNEWGIDNFGNGFKMNVIKINK
jgi:hypothetical protein